ncbi:hypothetical protein H0H92_009160 [Tricholoma furcatifolium]|nr:hypothetical protein H0H92_009160 [Tricholoma furcatifolium]
MHSGLPTLPRLIVPGLLDRTQCKRIRRHPNSTISFALFDPNTATSDDLPNIEQLSLKGELKRGQRVVIETFPSGLCTWRYVPKAERARGVPHEGTWPRTVEICGNFYECSQEQWDTYKLDPIYRCYIPPLPACPVISMRDDKPIHTPQPPPVEKTRTATPPSPARPRKKTVYFETESENEQSEVSDMIVDDEAHREAYDRRMDAARKARREKTTRRTEQLSNGAPPKDPASAPFKVGATPTVDSRAKSASKGAKRKVGVLYELPKANGNGDLEADDAPEEPRQKTARYVSSNQTNRTGTTPPRQARKKLAQKRAARREVREGQRKVNFEERRWKREAARMRDWFPVPSSDVEMPDATPQSQSTVEMDSPSPEPQPQSRWQDTNEDENSFNSGEKTPVTDDVAHNAQAAHDAAIEESRKKMAELEKDRHLWEAAAARRVEQERMEEETRRREAAARRHATAEAEKREKAERAEEERRRLEEEALAREREAFLEQMLKDRQRRSRIEQMHGYWTSQPWSSAVALERYRVLLNEFGHARFKPGHSSMTSFDVPWPMLEPSFDRPDITLEAVTRFFAEAKIWLSPEEFRDLIKKSNLRFHPDHWKNRLSSVENANEREWIAEAAEMIIQHLTSLLSK